MHYIVVRCPRCLVTIYSDVVHDVPRGFTVMSLADEDLQFYNCPMPLCEYHIPTFYLVNLYRNPKPRSPMHASPGFKIVQRTADTSPFRTPAQVAALAITLDHVEDELAKPPVKAWQADGQERPTSEHPVPQQATFEEPPAAEQAVYQSNGHGDKQNGTGVAAVAETKTIIPAGTKWTDAEVDKLKDLNSQSLAQSKIADEMGRPLSSVKYKLGQIREQDKLAKTQA